MDVRLKTNPTYGFNVYENGKLLIELSLFEGLKIIQNVIKKNEKVLKEKQYNEK